MVYPRLKKNLINDNLRMFRKSRVLSGAQQYHEGPDQRAPVHPSILLPGTAGTDLGLGLLSGG